jgi:hypothetical protein
MIGILTNHNVTTTLISVCEDTAYKIKINPTSAPFIPVSHSIQ